MMKQLNRLALVGTTAVTLLLAGCGANPNTVDPNDPYGNGGYDDPYGGGGYDDPSSGGGYNDPYGGGTGGYPSTGGGYPSTGGGYPSTTPLPVGGELTVGQLDKKKSGILLWKKLTVTGQIKNPTGQTLSGEVQISFTKKGKVVETQYEFVTDLQPNQTHSFEAKSKKSSDDVSVSVTTQMPTSPVSTYPGGGGYNSGYPSTGGGYSGGGSSYPGTGGSYPGGGSSYPTY